MSASTGNTHTTTGATGVIYVGTDPAKKGQTVNYTVLAGSSEATASFNAVTSNGNNKLVLDIGGKLKKGIKSVIFKVDFDEADHPRDWKGRFKEVPDEDHVQAQEAAVGDVLITKSGKLFQVEKQTDKGVKVNPVNPKNGEVKDGYTVLGNEIEVAVFEAGKEPGSQHPISELEPGTFVQHPNSGKRFKVGNHGKWVTVWPVDDQGNVAGKHTVLPPNTQMLITKSAVSPNVTKKQVDEIAKAKAAALAKVPPDPDPPGDDLYNITKDWLDNGPMEFSDNYKSAFLDTYLYADTHAGEGETWDASGLTVDDILLAMTRADIADPDQWPTEDQIKETRAAYIELFNKLNGRMGAYATAKKKHEEAMGNVMVIEPDRFHKSRKDHLREMVIKDVEADLGPMTKTWNDSESEGLWDKLASHESVEERWDALHQIMMKVYPTLAPEVNSGSESELREKLEDTIREGELAAMALTPKERDTLAERVLERFDKEFPDFLSDEDLEDLGPDSLAGKAFTPDHIRLRIEQAEVHSDPDADFSDVYEANEKMWVEELQRMWDEKLYAPKPEVETPEYVAPVVPNTTNQRPMDELANLLRSFAPFRDNFEVTDEDSELEPYLQAVLVDGGLPGDEYNPPEGEPWLDTKTTRLDWENWYDTVHPKQAKPQEKTSFALHAMEMVQTKRDTRDLETRIRELANKGDADAIKQLQGELDGLVEAERAFEWLTWKTPAINYPDSRERWFKWTSSAPVYTDLEDRANLMQEALWAVGPENIHGEAHQLKKSLMEGPNRPDPHNDSGWFDIWLKAQQQHTLRETYLEDEAGGSFKVAGVPQSGEQFRIWFRERSKALHLMEPHQDVVDQMEREYNAFLLRRDRMKRTADTLQEVRKARLKADTPPAPDMGDSDEILPKKLPKPPKKYMPGVGKDTVVVVEIMGKTLIERAHDDDLPVPISVKARVKRVPADDLDAAGEVIDYTSGIGSAIKLARSRSGPHERILRRDYGTLHAPAENRIDNYLPKWREEAESLPVPEGYEEEVPDFKKDVWFVSPTGMLQRAEVRAKGSKVWKPGSEMPDGKSGYKQTNKIEWHGVDLKTGQVKAYGSAYFSGMAMVVDPDDPEIAEQIELMKTADAEDFGGYSGEAQAWQMPVGWMRNNFLAHIDRDEKEIRQPHPEKYIPELRSEWDMGELHGQTTNEALKKLTKLGFREIRPRKNKNPKLINAHGRRLHVITENGKVDHVDALKPVYHGESESAEQLKARIDAALQTGADIQPLDPRNTGAPEDKHSISKLTVFDLALGKQNGVPQGDAPMPELEKPKKDAPKVKTDAEYRKEIEADKAVPALVEFEKDVPLPTGKTKARGTVIERFKMNEHDGWDFPTRMLEIPDTTPPEVVSAVADDEKDLDDLGWYADQKAAVIAIGRHAGVADLLLHESTVPGADPTFSDGLKADPDDGIYVAAARLADAWQKQKTVGVDSPMEDLDEPSRTWLLAQLDAASKEVDTKLAQREAERTEKAKALREAKIVEEVNKRRKAEGTIPAPLPEAAPDLDAHPANFKLPTYDEMHFEPQTVERITEQVSEIDGPYDVPVFFTGGMLRDGVAQFGHNEVWSRVDQPFDDIITERLRAEGAEEQENSQNLEDILGTYQGSGKIYPGQMLLLEEAGSHAMTPGEIHKSLVDEATKVLIEYHPNHNQPPTEGLGLLNDSEKANKLKFALDSIPTDITDPKAFMARFRQEAYGGGFGENAKDKKMQTEMLQRIMHVPATKGGGIKRIEYVPHAQDGDNSPDGSGNTTGAPTSQRGQIRMYGYTPGEAVQKLRELGITHDLEPEVPYNSILRSERRHGRIAPIHPAYLRGEAEPPTIKRAVTHGVTGGADDMLAILKAGAALPIAERIRVHTQGKASTSKKGDVRSGIDHGLFCTIGESHWGSIKLVFSDDVYLRRDLVVSPMDYGASASRYKSYTNHHNSLRKAAGEESANLYEPLSPAARQYHITHKAGSSGNEFNPVNGVVIEDIETIVVPSKQDRDKVNDMLDQLVSQGRINKRPQVTQTTPNLSRTS